ncbi:tRNA (adenosine(37)-N6)-dimethylallyltransferase MiaA [Eubacteriales bacterium OttesenSCG-928-N13]|nr:tRNA (adenosine(37)-N6)-dimethylallyltransferase MiaA [Eubacteriales bacterium OttesenSCG-928-N13]
MKSLLVLCGPTASGKSACALNICARLGGALVSCDSMQLYKGMDIGTAKPSAEERSSVPHFMLDMIEPDQTCSAAMYRAMAKPTLDSLFERNVQPVLCGGTGLYIDALTKPLGFAIEGDTEYRNQLSALSKEQLHQMLTEIDPDSANRLHVNDTRRVIRALEVHAITGQTLTERNRLDAERPGDYPAQLFALDWPREMLYDRINRRVDEMMERGLLQEVARLLDSGLSAGGTAMQAIGYKELVQVLRGDSSLSTAVERIKQATRNYAKRQLTWFRRDKRVHWIPAQDRPIDLIAQEIIDILGGETS